MNLSKCDSVNNRALSTHVRRLELDVDEDLLGVFRLGLPTTGRRAAGLQVTWEAILHPRPPWLHLPLESLLLAKRPHLCPELVDLVVLLSFELMQT